VQEELSRDADGRSSSGSNTQTNEDSERRRGRDTGAPPATSGLIRAARSAHAVQRQGWVSPYARGAGRWGTCERRRPGHRQAVRRRAALDLIKNHPKQSGESRVTGAVPHDPVPGRDFELPNAPGLSRGNVE